jgi:hypothetical protein
MNKIKFWTEFKIIFVSISLSLKHTEDIWNKKCKIWLKVRNFRVAEGLLSSQEELGSIDLFS